MRRCQRSDGSDPWPFWRPGILEAHHVAGSVAWTPPGMREERTDRVMEEAKNSDLPPA